MTHDTERLIEEAGRVVAQAEKQSALDAKYPPCTCSAPPRGHTMRQHDYRRLQVDELRAVLDACGNLVTALRAERERAEKAEEQARQQGVWAENIAAVAEQTNAVARDCIRERDAARAELARLTTPRPIAEAPRESGRQIIALWMHGDVVESMDVVCWADMDMDGDHPERKFWMNTAGDSVEGMTHFLPLPAEGGQR